MKRLLRKPPAGVLVWFGVLGAPIAWMLMFLFSYGLTLAKCNTGGSTWYVPIDAWTGVATGLAVVIGVLGLIASISVFRGTRGAEDVTERRIHFLAVVGLATTPLFICIILLAGLGAINLESCQQA